MSLEAHRRRRARIEALANNPLLQKLKDAAESRDGWQWDPNHNNAYMNIRNQVGVRPVVGGTLVIHARTDNGKLTARLRTTESVIVIPLADPEDAKGSLIAAEKFFQRKIEIADEGTQKAFRYAIRFLQSKGLKEEIINEFIDDFPFVS